ncbi:lytic transglycosylase domain-containing protein [Armatimonas sp.]|uniref:lytic transglycosylase domain-containing protein n=1 Tax=Armatimonas sp. TaxID=1872638 RepID=UPI00374D00F7
MTDAIQRIESRIQQIRALVDPPAQPLVKTTRPGENLTLTSQMDPSKEEFGTEFSAQLGRQPNCAPSDFPGGLTPLRKLLPPDVAAKMGISRRELSQSGFEPRSLAPVTLPLATRVRQDVSAAAIRLDPDEAMRRERYLPIIREAAAQTGLPEVLIGAVIQAESSFKPGTVSSAGAKGLMQLMPENEAQFGVRNVFDPHENIIAGSKHLREYVDRFGTLEKALAAFNAGPSRVVRYGGIPPFRETQDYVRRITGMLRQAGALQEMD